jgi:5-methyltetrahydrofolate--homocysteine methyltransferase
MNALCELLHSNEFILLDGAMGTMLMENGLKAGDPPEMWNVDHPQRIQAVHAAYIAQGSRLVLTNSFGGTRFRLKLHKAQDRVAELNRAAAQVARRAADAVDHTVVVAGSMGPTGELLEPLGTMTFEEAKAAFAEQAQALAEGGADVLWIETMSDLEEVRAAVEGARSVTDLPIAVCMTFDTNGHTMMGVSPRQAAEELGKLDLIAFGANCGNGTDEIEKVMAVMTQVAPHTPLIAKSNAGIPRLVGAELEYDGTPEVMAGYAYRVRQMGARLIGGCCGSTPLHLQAMLAALTGQTDPETLPDKREESSVAEVPTKKRRRERRRGGVRN